MRRRGPDHGALPRALDEALFWDAENDEECDALRARVAREGAGALRGSRRVVHLDAEDLAEGGIGRGPLVIGAHAARRRMTLREFSERLKDDHYAVRLNGTDYVVYSGEDQAHGPARIRAAAIETFLRMVNDHLSPRQPDRMLALDAGNDLHAFFLPPSIVPFFPIDEDRPALRPHMPTRTRALDGPPP